MVAGEAGIPSRTSSTPEATASSRTSSVDTERARSTSTPYSLSSFASSPDGTRHSSAISAIATSNGSRPCCVFDATSADSRIHACS